MPMRRGRKRKSQYKYTAKREGGGYLTYHCRGCGLLFGGPYEHHPLQGKRVGKDKDIRAIDEQHIYRDEADEYALSAEDARAAGIDVDALNANMVTPDYTIAHGISDGMCDECGAAFVEDAKRRIEQRRQEQERQEQERQAETERQEQERQQQQQAKKETEGGEAG